MTRAVYGRRYAGVVLAAAASCMFGITLAAPAVAQAPDLRVQASWRCGTDGECRATITTRLPAGQRAWTEYTIRRARTGARPIITTVTWCRARAACDDTPLAGSTGVR